MIKPKLLVVLLLGSCLADITLGSDDGLLLQANSLDNIKGHHFSQHEATVNAARRGAAERLARISAGSVGNPCGTTICYSSSGFSDNSDAETIGQGIVGFTSGASGSSSSASSSKYQAHEEVKAAVPVYPVVGGTKSSYVSSSHRQSSSSVASGAPNYIAATDGIKTRSSFGGSSGSSYGAASGATLVQPVIAAAYPIGQESSQSSHSSANRELYTYPVPVVDASNAYKSRSSYAASSERQASSVVQPVPVYSSGDQASRYVATARQDNYQGYRPSNTYVVYSKPVPVQIYTPVTSNIETSARFANADGTVYTQAPVKVVYPARSSSQYAANEEQQTYSSVGSQPVYSSSADRAAHSASNYRSTSSYQPVYQPVYREQVATAEESRRHSSERTGYPVDNSQLRTSAHNERHEDYNRRGSTYVPHTTSSGIVSKYSTYDQSQHANAAGSYVPIVPVTSDSRYSAQDQRHSSTYNSAVVQPVIGSTASSSSSKYSAEERRQQQLAGGHYYPAAGSSTLGSRYSSSEAQSAYNRQQSQVGGGYTPYPITNDALGRQFGSAGLGQLGGAHTDLNELMTEAERLAKVQAQNAYNGAVSGSSAIDTENRFGSDDSVTGGTGAGGFQRTKSWSSSSKWASGQKYGDDGKIKSYSSLSTAEAEQHNINGKKTGYKAATSTLEDDGKVSTYSLHTP